ncbi:MAG: hypothetical protein Q4G27_02175 [Flavobacteriaceae bacterium]|nr:hypothetical protein [Flavobacteriaceae bacterium]
MDISSAQNFAKNNNFKFALQGINENMILLEINATQLSQEEQESITGKSLALMDIYGTN